MSENLKFRVGGYSDPDSSSDILAIMLSKEKLHEAQELMFKLIGAMRTLEKEGAGSVTVFTSGKRVLGSQTIELENNVELTEAELAQAKVIAERLAEEVKHRNKNIG